MAHEFLTAFADQVLDPLRAGLLPEDYLPSDDEWKIADAIKALANALRTVPTTLREQGEENITLEVAMGEAWASLQAHPDYEWLLANRPEITATIYHFAYDIMEHGRDTSIDPAQADASLQSIAQVMQQIQIR